MRPHIRLNRKLRLTLGWKRRIPHGWDVRTRTYDLLRGFRERTLLRTEWSYDRSNEHEWIFLTDVQRNARRKWFAYLLQTACPHSQDGYSTRIPLLEYRPSMD